MAKWFSILSVTVILMLVMSLFYFVPNGFLIFFATFPYISWWTQHKEKTPIILPIIIIFALIFACILLPIISIAKEASFFYEMYRLIYPSGYSFTWAQKTPEFMLLTLGLTLSFLLFTKLFIWVFRHIWRKFNKKEICLAFSRLVMYIAFIYTIFAIMFTMLGKQFMDLLMDFVATSLVYDFFFTWMPFVALFFLFDHLFAALFHT